MKQHKHDRRIRTHRQHAAQCGYNVRVVALFRLKRKSTATLTERPADGIFCAPRFARLCNHEADIMRALSPVFSWSDASAQAASSVVRLCSRARSMKVMLSIAGLPQGPRASPGVPGRPRGGECKSQVDSRSRSHPDHHAHAAPAKEHEA